MSSLQAPACEIRRVIVHFYPEGVKGRGNPVELQFFGRRGKPVKKMRFVPAQLAHRIVRKLQGTKNCTVSVI